ncbi:MAG: two-component regulator propeller domain-containing protein, partial [Bacteroidia bacterium]
IWFGTQGSGISRFNGKTFKNFSKTDGLISNDVTSITEDKLGNIWIGTSEGASEFDGIKFHNFSEKEGLSNNSIYSIYNDDKNNIWVATSGGGVSIYDNQSDGIFKKITSSNGLSSNIVYAISQDKKGDYWFAMKNGISKYDGTKFTNYDKIPVVGNKTFFSITCDHFGNLWFGSIHGDVIKYDGKHFEQLEIPKDVNQDFIGSIVEDKHNNIWFATNHGALKYDGKSFHLFNENENLSSNFVLSLYCDYEGNMWIGTQEGGVDVFNNESFVNYTDKNGLSSNKVEAVLKGDSGELIVGTQGSGLNIYDNEKFSEINSIPELKQTSVFSIMKNEQGIWVGTESSGIFILKETAGKFSVVKHLGQIENNALSAVVKILDDRNGGAWLATYGSGLFHVKKDNTTEVFNSKTGIASDNILTVFEDSKGNIWMGTYDKGVVKYDPENSEKGANKFTTYSEKDGLADKAIWSIAEDDLHTIYLGTGEGGISCFDGKNFKTISTADGLCSNYAEALKWDPFDKSFWIGTNKGINKIKISKDFKIESIRYYGEQEGFKGVEVNQNAIVIDKEGMVWFGTNNGLCRYDRNFDFPNTTAPKLRLNDIRMFYQPVDWKNFSDSVDLKNNLPYKLELSHKNNHLTFDFQAMTTDNVRYTYLLEGQDNDWSPLSSNNEANFTNIAPGKNYVFKVKAINSNGIWSKDTVTFVFTINPPWWQTWWFYTLSIVLIAAAVYSYIHYRTTQYAKEKKILEEKVEERTAELSLALQDIKDSINYAKKIQEAIL